MIHGRYWIALFKEGGESMGVERELGRYSGVDEARSRYKQSAATYPSRIVMLCDRATALVGEVLTLSLPTAREGKGRLSYAQSEIHRILSRDTV
jgi:hypothetical protein